MEKGKQFGDSDTAPKLYHGTTHPLKAGDIVEPRVGGTAFAGTTRETARIFARGTKKDTRQGRVFEVAPVDPEEPLNPIPMKGAYSWTKQVGSSKGFRVVREVEHFAPDGKTLHKSPLDNCRSKSCKQ